MKLHAILVAAALAFGGAAFAQSGDTHGSSGDAPSASMAGKTHAQVHRKKVAKARRAQARHHASARHETHRRMHARADRGHHDTRAMGAGAGSPRTDLDAHARMDRMDSAYQDWLRQQGRS